MILYSTCHDLLSVFYKVAPPAKELASKKRNPNQPHGLSMSLQSCPPIIMAGVILPSNKGRSTDIL